MTYGVVQFLKWGSVAALIGSAYLALPNATEYPLPSEIGSAIALFAGYMKMFEFIFPVTLLFSLVGLTVIFEIAIFVFKRGMWFIGVVSRS